MTKTHRSYQQSSKFLLLRFTFLLITALYIRLSKAQQTIPTSIFQSPSNANGIATDSSGNVYVTDPLGGRVVKLNAAGVQQQVFTTTLPSLGGIAGVAVDQSGNVYIVDSNNQRVVKLDAAGVQQQVFTTTSPSLNEPIGVAVDGSNNVYIVDSNNQRVVKLDAAGVQQQIFTTTSPSLSFPEDVTVDGAGNVYISDLSNSRIVKLDAAGAQQQVFTTSPHLFGPQGIAVDGSGNLYIADTGNNRVVKLNAAGVQQQIFATTSPSLSLPQGIAIDGSGNLYIVDGSNNRVVIFGASGSIIGDPQFVGFQGQHFQFHGIPNEHFNLVSASDFFVNSHFVYLSTGTTEIYNDTEPFSHPGTYIDRLSFVLAGVRIELHAGSHGFGFSHVSVNGKSIFPGKRIALPAIGAVNDSFIHLHSQKAVSVSLGIITIDVTNSDYFFNLDARLNDGEMKKSGSKHVSVGRLDNTAAETKISNAYTGNFQLHGLLGQTWRNIEYNHKRAYQGEADDYLVSHLFDPNFVYSLFEEKV